LATIIYLPFLVHLLFTRTISHEPCFAEIVFGPAAESSPARAALLSAVVRG